MKLPAAVDPDDSWNDRRNESAHVFDIVEFESRGVVDFEILQRTNASGRGNQRSGNGMEVERMTRMVKRWEDDPKEAVAVSDDDSETTKLIRESRWNVRHECDGNHAKKALDRHCQEIPKEEGQLRYGLEKCCRDWFHHVLYQAITREKRIEKWENTFNHCCGEHSKCDHPAP
jgi:hypothetical protein